MWELDCEEGWASKNWCFWTVVLEKTLESPLDCKEIQPVPSKGDQSWVFFGRNDAEAETPVLWPPHAKSWLIGKDSDAGRDWGQEEKGTTEDAMAGWHRQLDGCEFEWTLGVGDGQGGLACCNSWGRKELDTTERLNWTDGQASLHIIALHTYLLIFAWRAPEVYSLDLYFVSHSSKVVWQSCITLGVRPEIVTRNLRWGCPTDQALLSQGGRTTMLADRIQGRALCDSKQAIEQMIITRWVEGRSIKSTTDIVHMTILYQGNLVELSRNWTWAQDPQRLNADSSALLGPQQWYWEEYFSASWNAYHGSGRLRLFYG